MRNAATASVGSGREGRIRNGLDPAEEKNKEIEGKYKSESPLPDPQQKNKLKIQE